MPGESRGPTDDIINIINIVPEVIDLRITYINKIIDDGKKHIGIENVRNRLENRVNGKLIIESEIGVGTKSTVYIPKKEIL